MRNPVLIREFLTSLRTWRALVLALLFLLILTAFVVVLWPAGGVYTVAARSSHKLFISMSLCLLALVSLCAPAFTAVSITREKERRTYDMLYHTLLRADQIIVGKLVAGIGYVLMLIVASMPIMGVCLVLGGVGLEAMLRVYLVVVISGLFFGLLGLLCSAFSRSSFPALILCYMLVLAICGLTWVPSVVLGLWAESVHLIHMIRGISPFAAVVSVVAPDYFAAEHPVPPTAFGAYADSIWVFCLLAPAAALGMLAAAYAKIMQPPQPKSRNDTEIIENRLDLIKRRVTWPFYLLDPRKRKRMIGRLINIILVKEMRSKAFGRSVWIIRSMYTALVVSLVLAFLPLTQIAKIGIDTIVVTCVSLPLGIILLISPVLTATTITEEREKGVLDMLRCSLVSAWTIVMGKLELAWFSVGMIVASTFPTFFVLAYVSAQPKDMEHLSEGINLIRPFRFRIAEGVEHLSKVDFQFVHDMLSAFGVVILAMVLATLIGIAASSWSRRSSTATAVAYGAVLLWGLGTLVPYLIAESLPAAVVRAALTVNPFVAAANAVSSETFRNLPPNLWMQSMRFMGGACVVILILTLLRVRALMRPDR